MPDCFFLRQKSQPSCFIQLGRMGDIMILLPAMKHLHDKAGVKPVMAVSTEFASILDGVGYVEPWAMDVPWVGGVDMARMSAQQVFQRVVVPKWWDCPGLNRPGQTATRGRFISTTKDGGL